MAEYINREAVEAHLNRRLEDLRAEYGDYNHYTDGYEEAVCAVEDFPAADVVPVVHGEWKKLAIAGNPGGAACTGCSWLGKRVQKCSTCRRNRRMKDNYKEE